jgi:hypothetical protein
MYKISCLHPIGLRAHPLLYKGVNLGFTTKVNKGKGKGKGKIDIQDQGGEGGGGGGKVGWIVWKMKKLRRIRAEFFKLKVEDDQGRLVSQHQKKDDED